jgi:hypothetical protein
MPLEVSGSQLPEYAKCSDCDASISLVQPLGNIVTMLLTARAKQELAHNDITICTLLSAVAVEAEMSYLYLKWRAIESQKLPADQTLEDKKQWEEECTNMRSISKRLDELSRLLTGKPFDEFACLNKELFKPSLIGYKPATSFKDFFQEQFFQKRNQIVHYGKIDFGEADGTQSLSLATALLDLFRAMDTRRINILDEAHKKAREKSAETEI